MDLSTLRQIIQQESPIRLEVGTVVAVDPRGTRTVSVRLSGGRVCSRVRTCVDDLEIGSQVLVARMMQLDQVVVIGQLLSDVNPVLARRGILAPPTNLTVGPVPAAIVVRWDTYPGEDICWQVRYNTSASDTGATDVLVTRGSYYTHYVVDGSGDMATAATYHFKVRALRWLGDNNVMYSAWSAWGNATSGGHNLRELVEVELQNATELTISGGVVTRTQAYHVIDTEGDASADNLDTINGGVEGDLLVIRPASDSRTVVVKHGTGNVWLLGKQDVSLDDLNDHIVLIYSTSGWWCDMGGGGGGGGGSSTFTGLTDTPGDYIGHKRELLAVTDAEAALNFIAATGWLSTGDHSAGDASDIRWQPDCLAVLRGGVVTEYQDPDDAFDNADTDGDVILVPSGEFTLTSTQVVAAGVSVRGIGPVTKCILKGSPAGSLIQMAAGDGEISNLSILYTNTTGGAGTVAGLVLNTGNYAHHLYVYAVNEDTAVLAGCDGIQCYTYGARIEDCYVRAETYGENAAIGISASVSATIHRCYAWGIGHVANKVAIGIYGSDNAVIRWSYLLGYNGAGGAAAYGLYAAGNTHIEHSTCAGLGNNIKVVGGKAYVCNCQYDNYSGVVEWTKGDRAGVWRDEVIMGRWEFNMPIKMAESLDPIIPGPGAGHVYLYAKDVGGSSWMYYVDDKTNPWGLVSGIKDTSVTVGAGKDFATIQEAIDYFKNRVVSGDCLIAVDPGSYDEALDFSSIVIAAGATLTMTGDTRVLAGMSYVDGMLLDRLGLWANAGSGTCNLANAGNNITVTGATTNPDFDADGWGNGDRILVKDNSNAITEQTISSVLNNVITLTGTAPAVGNNGSAIALIPNRAVERSTAGAVLNVSGVQGVGVNGFYLQSIVGPGTGCHGLVVGDGGLCKYRNLLTYTDDYGLYASGTGCQIAANGYYPSSCWETGNTAGNLLVIATTGAAISCTLLQVVGQAGAAASTANGIYAQHQATIWAVYTEVSGCDRGVWATWQAEVFAAYTMARYNDYGFVSQANSMIAASYTMTPSAGFNVTADYVPNPGGAGQYAEDNTPAATATYGVLYKS